MVDAILSARPRGAAVILMMGAHVIKQGLSRYVTDLIRRGFVTLVATNGACAVHDWELAVLGATSESVSKYIKEGKFGLWKESAEINDMVAAGDRDGLGFGEAVGKAISESNVQHKDISIFAAACGVASSHRARVSVGYERIHEHPNYDGAATGYP